MILLSRNGQLYVWRAIVFSGRNWGERGVQEGLKAVSERLVMQCVLALGLRQGTRRRLDGISRICCPLEERLEVRRKSGSVVEDESVFANIVEDW